MKKSILVIISVVLIFSGIVCVLAISGSERQDKNNATLVARRKLIKCNEGIFKKNVKRAKSKLIRQVEIKHGKPIILNVDEDAKLSAEMKKILLELQDALDREDRRGASRQAAKIQEMLKRNGAEAVPVSVRLRAVEALGWFLPDTLSDLVTFMSDSSPDVVDDVMTAFEEALDNISLGDRELSQIVKSVSKVLSNEDALDSLFFCIESDMRNSVAVDTYKYVMENGSDACKARILESVQDFTGEEDLKTKEDLENWLKGNPDDEYDEEFYAGEKE